MSKRRDTRVEMNRPVELKGSIGTLRGIVRDFSPRGCCVHLEERNVVHCGLRVTLRISLPDRMEPVEVTPAIVTWTHEQAFGVEFFTTSQATRARLKEVYDQLLEAQTVEAPIRVISLPAFAMQ